MQPSPTPDTLRRYDGFTSHGGAYHSDDVRRILADAHAHYEAQVKPLAGLANPDTGALFAAVEAAREWFGEALALKLALAGTDVRVEALREAMRDAARTLEGAHLGDGQEVAQVVAKSLRRAAQ